MAVNVQNYKKLTGKGTGEAKEYTVAEIADVYHPNLLVNGDFQIWQRGTSFEQYVSQYTADMWQATCGVEKVDNGAKLIFDGTMILGQYKRTIQQFIPNSKLYSGKKASIGISIDGVSYEVKGTFLESQDINGVQETIDDLEIALGWSNSKQMYTLMIRSDVAKTVIINYVDLFEGDIAYPHVKEDYAIALMRCQFFIQVLRNLAIRMCLTSQSNFYFRYPLLQRMNDNATVTVLNQPNVITSTGQSLSIKGLEYSTMENTQLRIVFTSSSNEGKDVMLDGLSVLISCEPL